jgi:hypothetical protein
MLPTALSGAYAPNSFNPASQLMQTASTLLPSGSRMIMVGVQTESNRRKFLGFSLMWTESGMKLSLMNSSTWPFS